MKDAPWGYPGVDWFWIGVDLDQTQHRRGRIRRRTRRCNRRSRGKLDGDVCRSGRRTPDDRYRRDVRMRGLRIQKPEQVEEIARWVGCHSVAGLRGRRPRRHDGQSHERGGKDQGGPPTTHRRHRQWVMFVTSCTGPNRPSPRSPLPPTSTPRRRPARRRPTKLIPCVRIPSRQVNATLTCDFAPPPPVARAARSRAVYRDGRQLC